MAILRMLFYRRNNKEMIKASLGNAQTRGEKPTYGHAVIHAALKRTYSN